MKRQNDNTSPGLGRGRLVPSSHKGSKFRDTIVRQFNRGDERIREDIPDPDSLGEEAFLVGIFTSRGNLKDHRVLISATPVLWDKVICRNSGFTF